MPPGAELTSGHRLEAIIDLPEQCVGLQPRWFACLLHRLTCTMVSVILRSNIFR
jgi:hypothetical protein